MVIDTLTVVINSDIIAVLNSSTWFVSLSSAGFKQSPPNITGPNINTRKRRHGEEEIYYIPVGAFQISDV